MPSFRLSSGIGLCPRAYPDYLISGDLWYSAPYYTSRKQLLSASGEESALSFITALPLEERNARFEPIEGINHNSKNGDHTHHDQESMSPP
jgi:hypothetical protein